MSKFKHFTLFHLAPDVDSETGIEAAARILKILHETLQNVSKKHRRASLEIITRQQKIHFYIFIPTEIKGFIQSQIYAQYSSVILTESNDYSADFLKHTKDFQFHSQEYTGSKIPLYRFSDFQLINEDIKDQKIDFLSALSTAINSSDIKHNEMWLQIVIEPLAHKKKDFLQAINTWKLKNLSFDTALYNLRQGHSFSRRLLSLPFSLLFFQNKMWGNYAGVQNNIETYLGEAKESQKKAFEKGKYKLDQPLFEATLRIANYTPIATSKQDIEHNFKNFETALLYLNNDNSWKKIRDKQTSSALFSQYRNRRQRKKTSLVLSANELATFWHMPLKNIKTSGIQQNKSVQLEPPGNIPLLEDYEKEQITALGKAKYHGSEKTFGMLVDDRRRHSYVIGKTGMGKSVLLENMIYSDIMSGKGIAVVDPHGDLAERAIDFVPSHRINDLVIFDPGDRDYPISFNMLEVRDEAQKELVASGMLGIFKKMFEHSWGPRLEYILRNTLLTLLENEGQTMLGIPLILTNKGYREKMVKPLNDIVLKNFWENEFEVMQDRQKTEAVAPILNKVGQFLSSPMIRNIVGQSKSAIDLRFAMDTGKIVIVNISKGKIGEDFSALLGSMMITKFQIDAMTRANIAESERKDFFLYVDEFQNFATDSFASILSEARKYRLSLTMANQYISQMSDEVKEAIFGNCGSIMSFQVGATDATSLVQQFSNEINDSDLLNIPKWHIYLKLLIDGMPSSTFSASTLPPPGTPQDPEQRAKMLKYVRQRYAKPRAEVEEKISKFSNTVSEMMVKEKTKKKPNKKPFNPQQGGAYRPQQNTGYQNRPPQSQSNHPPRPSQSQPAYKPQNINNTPKKEG
jgi:hypothetical protein